ncbi:phosphopantothenate-cysteine ligase /phosphopantothenoylcysteine decarboxylase [Nitrosospira sp. Nsp2]|uniref:bifunctional phosphopantothenoylcysteine decarboxylase/phosphopantothenate--cysteine ligase CoaBC n=1 Tax=Nitrosospira sp. Nsp2 TaxID=136548 RepID=UPI000D318635|nr:bifunctional phosphopantothenoylcysteine decarboxylase/phosphopantothenate--cysteine ligase CoaBC [Nitrosospira sp. Nsp2]PTR17038.1 phosphopantothenate-cysteine ligase /phosphopantothenoylcysteine decarboxylase [Nitrosospira sp. Nsp2]
MTDTSLPRIRLILGLTGGVAAYKAAELARLLMHDGVDVQAVMTRSACHFVGTATLQALTGKPVLTELWDERLPNGMAHIDLSRNADAILVAPASADFIAKLTHGLADDLLSTLCLARDCPLLIAPAMNRQMWENAATQRNIDMLERDGLTILGPGSGPQACGETGIGRMLEAYELAESVRAFFEPRLLQGKRVLVTAGPTYEAIDAVRGIMNLSSGKMGYAIARAARDAGAEVILVSGPVCLQPPSALKFLSVTSAEDMLAVVKNEISLADIFVSVAAVADYRAIRVSGHKIKKTGSNITLELTPNQDILAYAAGLPHAPFCVGFAAETENLEENAEAKRRKKRLPLLVANLAQEAIGSEECELTLLDDSGRHFLPKAPKLVQARRLVKHIASMQKKNS